MTDLPPQSRSRVENRVPTGKAGIYAFFASRANHNNGEPVCLLVGKSESSILDRIKPWYLNPSAQYCDKGGSKRVYMECVFGVVTEMLHAAGWDLWCELRIEASNDLDLKEAEKAEWKRLSPVLLQERPRVVTKGLNLNDEGVVWTLKNRDEAYSRVTAKLLVEFARIGIDCTPQR